MSTALLPMPRKQREKMTQSQNTVTNILCHIHMCSNLCNRYLYYIEMARPIFLQLFYIHVYVHRKCRIYTKNCFVYRYNLNFNVSMVQMILCPDF